jgi:hypothetical protein
MSVGGSGAGVALGAGGWPVGLAGLVASGSRAASVALGGAGGMSVGGSGA